MNPGEFQRVWEKNRALINEFCKENKFLYRFLPLERFLETMQKSHLVFVSPKKWNDPFDNLLFRQEVKNKDSIINRIYTCCFTLNPHSQAYWKTYAEQGFCVRLRIKSQEFFELLMRHNEKISFGRMKYVKERDLQTELSNIVGLKKAIEDDKLSNTFLEAFHLKGKPFEYESELRIILLSELSEGGLKRISIDLKSIIDDIYLDPRMEHHETIAWKEYLKKFGIRVKKSLLFKDKKIEIK